MVIGGVRASATSRRAREPGGRARAARRAHPTLGPAETWAPPIGAAAQRASASASAGRRGRRSGDGEPLRAARSPLPPWTKRSGAGVVGPRLLLRQHRERELGLPHCRDRRIPAYVALVHYFSVFAS